MVICAGTTQRHAMPFTPKPGIMARLITALSLAHVILNKAAQFAVSPKARLILGQHSPKLDLS
jgi:hypothetical protein